MTRPPSPTAAVVAAVVVLGSCGTGGGGSEDTQASPGRAATTTAEACGPVVTEPLDPRSTQHLLPGAPAPTYAADPPTSGPHLSGVTLAGNQREPIEGPAQVALLEAGAVVVQYRPGLPERESSALAGLAGDKVVVAPNPSLPDPVVATAWRHRVSCRAADVAALSAFISERVGKGPG